MRGHTSRCATAEKVVALPVSKRQHNVENRTHGKYFMRSNECHCPPFNKKGRHECQTKGKKMAVSAKIAAAAATFLLIGAAGPTTAMPIGTSSALGIETADTSLVQWSINLPAGVP